MKVCPSCAKENKDSAKFCTGCGLSLAEVTAVPGEPAPEPAPSAEPIYKPEPEPAPAETRPQAPAAIRTPAQAKLKEIAGSTLALVICIAFTVMVLCSVCASLFVSDSFNSFITEGFEKLREADLAELIGDDLDISEKDIDDAIDQITDAMSSAAVRPSSLLTRIVSAVSSNAVSILFAVSLWIIYGVAKKKEAACCGTAGLKIIRVLRTIGLVLAIILSVLAVLGLLFAIFMTIREGYDEAKTALIVLGGFTAVCILLMLLFLGGCVNTLKKLISVSENRSCRNRISGFVRFILFVGGIFSAIAAIFWIITIFSTGADMAVFAASSAAAAVYQFSLSKFLGRSRKALKAV